MSRKQRQGMIDREHNQLSLVRQCTLLKVSRGSLYYQPTSTKAEDLALMDRQYLKTPFYGSRRMKVWLQAQGHPVGRNKVRRLMRLMGLEAIYRRPNTSKPAPEHRVYPYLLRGWKSTESIRYGAPISPTCPWPRAFCTWWPSWTGTAGTCCPGGYPIPWTWISASKLWKKP